MLQSKTRNIKNFHWQYKHNEFLTYSPNEVKYISNHIINTCSKIEISSRHFHTVKYSFNLPSVRKFFI